VHLLDDRAIAPVGPVVTKRRTHHALAGAAPTRRTIYCAAGFNRGNEILAGYNMVGYLPSINVPTAVHCGTGDIWPFGDDEKMAKNIAGATLKYFPNSGHGPLQEERAAHIAYLRGFVATVEADELTECHPVRHMSSASHDGGG